MKSCPTLATPQIVAHQAPLSTRLPRQEYWSGLPFPSPGDLSKPGTETMSPVSPALAGRFSTTDPPGKPPGREYVRLVNKVVGKCEKSKVIWGYFSLL